MFLPAPRYKPTWTPTISIQSTASPCDLNVPKMSSPGRQGLPSFAPLTNQHGSACRAWEAPHHCGHIGAGGRRKHPWSRRGDRDEHRTLQPGFTHSTHRAGRGGNQESLQCASLGLWVRVERMATMRTLESLKRLRKRLMPSQRKPLCGVRSVT